MKKMNPKCLYPTETLESIQNDTILFYVDKIKKNEPIMPIMVYRYEGYYFIIEGHHRMLASVVCGAEEIDTVELKKNELPEWCDDSSFTETINGVGMRTVYDFEAVGNFCYEEYPKYYLDEEKR